MPRRLENMGLTMLFGSKREDVIGRWRQLHSVELHNFYSPLNTIWVFGLRKIRFVERLKINGEEGICTQDFSEEA
jgi:hypothetical protein